MILSEVPILRQGARIMALIKYGQGVASMSGKQGGSVHSRGRTGAVIKDWTKPCNPITPAQSQRRATFSAQTAAWGNLTNAQRSSWNAWAQTQSRLNRQGDVYVPTGRQMYIELNANLQLIGQAAITAPPQGSVPPAVASALTLTATITAGAVTALSVAGGSTDATVLYYIKGAPAQMFRDTVAFSNVVNGTASWVLTDDLEVYERAQRGLTAAMPEWVVVARGAGGDVEEPGGFRRGATGTSELFIRRQFEAWRKYMGEAWA
jgi:hypothetical protein